MTLEDSLEPIWTFFLQEIRKYWNLSYKELKSSQDILFDVTYQAYLSAVYDILENPLYELATLERLLVFSNYGGTTSVIKLKLQKNFITNLETLNASIAQKVSEKRMSTPDVQKVILCLYEAVKSEQLQSNSRVQEAFTYIFIASLVPLTCLGASKYNLQEHLKLFKQFEPTVLAKIPNSGSFLFNSIIYSFFVNEKAKDMVKYLCKPSDQEEINNGLEAMCACLMLISAYLKRKISSSIELPMACHDKAERQQLTPKEELDHSHSFFMAGSPAALSSTLFIPVPQKERHNNLTAALNTRGLNFFLLRATNSLKTNVYTSKSIASSANRKDAEEFNHHMINCNFPVLYHIEKVIKAELANFTVNTSHITLSKFFSEFLLLDHITGLRSILFMQAGIIMEQFCFELIRKIEVVTVWNQESWLTLSLHNLMSNGRLTWFCGYVSVKLTCKEPYGRNSSALSESELTIKYTAPWPINLIINQESLELYNNVFKFLLDMKRSIISLQKLSFKDLDSTSAIYHTLLFWLRTWMMHFLNSVYSYFMECVLQPIFFEFDSQIHNWSSFEHLALSHYNYVRDIHWRCFLNQGYEFLNHPIREIADFAIQLSSLWDFISSDDALHEMQDKFLYRYDYVVSVLNSAACRSTFPFIETLATALGYGTRRDCHTLASALCRTKSEIHSHET